MANEILCFQIINLGSINLNNLRKIASEPKDENVFVIDSYDELRNLQKLKLPNKICAVTGDSANGTGNEMSLERFSLAFFRVGPCC